jgi:hypothetical protein
MINFHRIKLAPIYSNSQVIYWANNPITIAIENLQNRLLKVCYVPATSAGLNRLLFCCSG